MARLSVHNAVIGYPNAPVLSDVTFAIEPGSICCLLGANGCGKTTLMRTLLGVLPLTAGRIVLDNIPVTKLSSRQRAQTLAWVPQAHEGAFAFSVLEMVLMGCSPHLNTFSQPSVQEKSHAMGQLESLGIAHLAGRHWSRLSGGERQLTLIARALAQRPKLLLLDEPASSLDFGHQIQLLDRLRELRRTGISLLMSTHHPLHASAIADSVLRIEPEGTLTQGPPESQLHTENLANLYRVTPEQIRHHLGNLYSPG